MRRWWLKQVLYLVLLALVLYASAETLAWPVGGALWGLSVALQLVAGMILTRKAPDLLEERSQVGQGVMRWDIPLALTLAYGPLLALSAAGIEFRRGALPPPQAWRLALGALVMITGWGFTLWAMLANRFFSGVVRIQAERGHQVATGGPYVLIRHPGYVGALGYLFGAALFLGSVWALVVTLVVAASTVLRTALEDRTLQRELPGYADYARRVRYRLIPGLW